MEKKESLEQNDNRRRNQNSNKEINPPKYKVPYDHKRLTDIGDL